MSVSLGGEPTTSPAELAELTGRDRVYVFDHGDEDGLATVLSRGTEVSRVRFDRADVYGKEGTFSNDKLKPAFVKKKPKSKEPDNEHGSLELPE